MNDERLALPSASSFETDALCPGRQNLLRSLGNQIVIDATPDPEAERGTRIHKAFELDDPSELEEDDLPIFENGQKTRQQFLQAWVQDFGRESFQGPFKEVRLWLNWPDTLAPACSGKLDCYWVSAEYGAIDELKSLWASNLTPAERNLQGRLQAVLIAKEHDLKHVRVNFNKAMYRKSDTVDYTEDDLKRAEESIFSAVWESTRSDAPRRAGNHCRHCAAKPHCPEAGAWSLLPSVKTSEELVSRLSLEDCKLIWQRSAVIGKILDEVKKRLKSLSDEELAQLGLSRHEGRALDPVKDVQGAFQFLLNHVPEEALWSALKMGKTELAKILAQNKSLSQKAAGQWIKTHLEQFIESKQSESYLEEV